MQDITLIMRALCLVLAIGTLAAAQTRPGDAVQSDSRIGFEEDFDSVDGWTKIAFPGESADLKSIASIDGVAHFVTHPAPLGSRMDEKWSDGLPLIDAFSNLRRDYDQTVDLDRYPYLVVKIDEKSCPAALMLNGSGTPIAYTTGIRAIDLRDYDRTAFRGRQRIWFRIQFLNTGGTLKIDWIRLVSELTPEEKKGLIPAGHRLRPEPLVQDTTQGLAQVMQRVGRVRPDQPIEPMLCFRDSATGAIIWRMTGLGDDATVVSDSVHSIYNASGSHMLILSRTRGPLLYDLSARTWRAMPHASISRFSPSEPDILWCIERISKPAGLRFHRINIRTGLDEVMGQITFDPGRFASPVTELGFSEGTDRIAVGLRETPFCFVFDPSQPYEQRVRMIELPMRLKGMGLSPDGKRLFFNRCYWYESWEMDLDTGELRLAMTGGGSHAGSGAGLRLSHYEGSIVAYPSGYTGGTPGDLARILLNYREGWSTDYGHLSGNGMWYIANGWGEPMHQRLIMANVQEPGTVLHVGFMNTSREGWDNNTVIRSSPDATKLAWTSDLWGYNAVCVAFTRQPEPPRNLQARRDGRDVVLKWERAMLNNDLRGRSPAELAGYHVYRSVDGGPMVALTHQPVSGNTWREEDAPENAVLRYVAVSAEHSGLEGVPSNEAVVAPAGNQDAAPTPRFHFEAELCRLTPPARAAFDGYAGGFQHVRIRRTRPGEQLGQITQTITVPDDTPVHLWLRCRVEDTPGKFRIDLDSQSAGEVAVEAAAWHWVRLDTPLALAGQKEHRLVLASADEGLCIDRFILVDDPAYVPSGIDDRFSAPPRPVEQLLAPHVSESAVRLAWWNPRAEIDVDYYNVYAAEGDECPIDQAHLIASTRDHQIVDWGLSPGRTYTYAVAAVNRRGLTSAPRSVTVTTQALEQRVLIELPIAQAKLDPRLVRDTRGGVEYAYLPDQGQDSANAPPAEIAWEFELPVAGRYHIWCRYAPGDLYPTWHRVNVALDELHDGKAVWRMRTPFRTMAGTAYRNWKTDLWFSDRVHLYTWPRAQEEYRLLPGTHTLTIRLAPQMREFSHKISQYWITNDPSWRPPGFDPQADFTKAKIQRE